MFVWVAAVFLLAGVTGTVILLRHGGKLKLAAAAGKLLAAVCAVVSVLALGYIFAAVLLVNGI